MWLDEEAGRTRRLAGQHILFLAMRIFLEDLLVRFHSTKGVFIWPPAKSWGYAIMDFWPTGLYLSVRLFGLQLSGARRLDLWLYSAGRFSVIVQGVLVCNFLVYGFLVYDA